MSANLLHERVVRCLVLSLKGRDSPRPAWKSALGDNDAEDSIGVCL